MRKLNLTQKFSLLSLLSVGILSVAMGLVTSHLLTRSMLNWEWLNTAGVVRAQAEGHNMARLFTDPRLRADRGAVRDAFEHMLALPEVVRIKVFDRTGTVLWSDEEELIGRAFPENPALGAALRGEVTALLKDLDDPEHEYERPRFAKLAEVYVPIFGDGPGEVIGVIEVYKTPAILFASIRTAQVTIWAIALLGGLILYASLLPIVRRAYGTQLRLEADLRAHVDRLSLLYDLSAQLHASLSLEEILADAMRQVVRAFGAKSAVVFLFDAAGQVSSRVGVWLSPAHEQGDFPRPHGLTRTILATGEPAILPDVREVPDRVHPAVLAEGVRAQIAIPLRSKGKVLGAFFAYYLEPHAFSPDEVETLVTYANQLAIAAENARLYEGTRRSAEELEARVAERTQQLQAVRAVGEEITRELDLPTLLELIIRRATGLVGGGSGEVYLWDEAAQVLVPQAWVGHGEWVREVRFRLGEGASGTAAQRRQGLIVNDYRTWPAAAPAFLEHSGITATVAMPLLYRDRLLGAITVDHQEIGRPFTEQDLETLALFASQAAIAIENARLYAATQRAANEARSLYEVAHSLATSLDPTEVLRLIAAKTTELLGTPHAQVVLWDEAAQALRLGAAHGTETDKVRDQRFRLGQGVHGLVAQTRAPLVVNDYQASPHRVPGLTEVVADIAVPLLYRGQLLGVLNSHATEPGAAFTPEHLALLTGFADQAAIAIANARLYEEIRQAAEQLEARVRERTAELEATNQELARANKAKSEFLANMSHELRTPLNAILGFSEVLHDQAFGSLNDRQQKYVAHIESAGRHLLAIISDLLDFAKIEAGRLDVRPEPLEVAPALAEALALVREAANRKGIALDATGDGLGARVLADPVRLNQILYNLLSNAVKFTPTGGRVSVTARRVAGRQSPVAGPGQPSLADDRGLTTHGDFVEIAVQDTGIGIAAEDLPRLFQEFVQLESPMVKRHAGAGLGLALTRRLVEMHGGAIAATSPGKGLGTTFTVRLPAVASDPASEDHLLSQEVPA